MPFYKEKPPPRKLVLGVAGYKMGPKTGGYSYPNRLSELLEDQIKASFKLIDPTLVITGCHPGIEMWAVKHCIKMKIPFEIIIPFNGYEKLWPNKFQDEHKKYLAKAVDVKTLYDDGYSSFKYYKKDEYLVDNSDEFLVFMDGSVDEMSKVHAYARNAKKKIHKIMVKHHG